MSPNVDVTGTGHMQDGVTHQYQRLSVPVGFRGIIVLCLWSRVLPKGALHAHVVFCATKEDTSEQMPRIGAAD